MRPFGYEVDRFTVREDEANHIRDAAERVLAGASIRSVASMWNEAGVPTTAGNEWQSIVLRRVLASFRIAGKQPRKDGTLVEAPWPAIIDEISHKRLRDLLVDPERIKTEPVSTRTYLLTGGMATCGLCGTQLVARPDNYRKRGYVCSSGLPSQGCGKIRVNADLLENEVGNRLLGRLMKTSARRDLKVLAKKVQAVSAESPAIIAVSEMRLVELGKEYATGSITASTMRSATATLKLAISDARAATRNANALENLSVLDVDDMIEWWEGASVEQQRTLLSILVGEIAVMPATVKGSKTFDTDRVRVEWR